MPGEFSPLAVPHSREDGAEDRLVYARGAGRDSESLWNMKPREMERKKHEEKKAEKKSSREEAPRGKSKGCF